MWRASVRTVEFLGNPPVDAPEAQTPSKTLPLPFVLPYLLLLLDVSEATPLWSSSARIEGAMDPWRRELGEFPPEYGKHLALRLASHGHSSASLVHAPLG